MPAPEQSGTGVPPVIPYQSDELLLRAAGNGNRGAFGTFVERHHQAIVQFAYRFLNCRSRETAEDVAQDVFLKAWQAARSYKPQARATTWLFRIATNTCLNQRRADRLRRTLSLSEGDLRPARADDSGHTSTEADNRVRDQITRLPAAQRAAIVLRHYHDLPYGEIAEILGTSIASVESLLFRARRALREALQSEREIPQVSTKLRAEIL